MTRKEMDGGTAFPFVTNCPGMSLRDYFAGQALTGILANNMDLHATEMAFRIADNMIARRRAFYAEMEQSEKNKPNLTTLRRLD